MDVGLGKVQDLNTVATTVRRGVSQEFIPRAWHHRPRITSKMLKQAPRYVKDLLREKQQEKLQKKLLQQSGAM